MKPTGQPFQGFADQSGVSLIETLVSIAIISVAAGLFSMLDRGAFQISRDQMNRIELLANVQATTIAIDCVSTIGNLNTQTCVDHPGTPVVLRDSAGNPLPNQNVDGGASAVCDENGVSVRYDTDFDGAPLNPGNPGYFSTMIGSYKFCSAYMDGQPFHRTQTTNLTATGRSCRELFDFPSLRPPEPEPAEGYYYVDPQEYSGTVTCPAGYYAITGGVDCSQGDGLLVSTFRDPDPTLGRRQWKGVCCSENIGFSGHKVLVTCIKAID